MDNQERIGPWVFEGSRLVAEYINLCLRFIDEKRTFEHWIADQLAVSCQLTSESTFILIDNLHLWDAEILIRSVTEGSFKLLYLSIGDNDSRKTKFSEYWEDLWNINLLKRHRRFSDFLSKVDNPNADEWLPLKGNILNQRELDELEGKYPRSDRQRIEQKWSFNEILKSLSRPDIDYSGYSAVTGMSYGYGIASNLIHQDSDAIRLIWDRCNREPERRTSLELAHAAREVSDLVTFAMMRTYSIFRLHDADREPFNQLNAIYEKGLALELKQAQVEWWNIESQY